MNIWDFNEEIIEQKTGQLLAAGAYFQEIAGKMETWRVYMNCKPFFRNNFKVKRFAKMGLSIPKENYWIFLYSIKAISIMN